MKVSLIVASVAMLAQGLKADSVSDSASGSISFETFLKKMSAESKSTSGLMLDAAATSGSGAAEIEDILNSMNEDDGKMDAIDIIKALASSAPGSSSDDSTSALQENLSPEEMKAEIIKSVTKWYNKTTSFMDFLGSGSGSSYAEFQKKMDEIEALKTEIENTQISTTGSDSGSMVFDKIVKSMNEATELALAIVYASASASGSVAKPESGSDSEGLLPDSGSLTFDDFMKDNNLTIFGTTDSETTSASGSLSKATKENDGSSATQTNTETQSSKGSPSFQKTWSKLTGSEES